MPYRCKTCGWTGDPHVRAWKKCERCGVGDDRIFVEADSGRKRIAVNELVIALAVGVLNSDLWTAGYQVPDGFEEVLNAVARGIHEAFGAQKHVELSLGEVEVISETGLTRSCRSDGGAATGRCCSPRRPTPEVICMSDTGSIDAPATRTI